jgi:biopolymer transport protein ExbB
MTVLGCSTRSTRITALAGVWCLALAAALHLNWHASARAQEVADGPPAADAVTGPATPVPNEMAPADSSSTPAGQVTQLREEEGLNLFVLLVKGGWLMIPIGLMSLVVVIVAIERTLALRSARVLPGALIDQLGQLGDSQGAFDPREAYRICQRYPSAAANVVRSMLLKIGRPHSEVEHTVAEASQREADRLFANVRWLTLAAGVTPLIGLLGTVWGMIDAFHRTTQLAPGQNKAEELATGIYIALVTTFGGLMVAIPAAICAHFFEGRIQKLFHQIDELLFNLLPQIERFEGQVRFGRTTAGQDEG